MENCFIPSPHNPEYSDPKPLASQNIQTNFWLPARIFEMPPEILQKNARNKDQLSLDCQFA